MMLVIKSNFGSDLTVQELDSQVFLPNNIISEMVKHLGDVKRSDVIWQWNGKYQEPKNLAPVAGYDTAQNLL